MESLPFAQKQQQQQQQQLLGGEEQAPSDASTAIHSSLSDAVNSSLFWHQTPRSCQVSPPYQHPTFAPCPYASTLSASASTDSASYTPFAPVALQGLTVPQVLHIILPSTPPLPKSSSSVTSLPTTPPPERLFPLAPTPKLRNSVAKLWHLVSHPEAYRHCICWSQTGNCIVLCHSNPRFTKAVYASTHLTVPELAQHVVLKPDDPSKFSAWAHPEFRRGHKARLAFLVPRESKARRMKKASRNKRRVSPSSEA